MPQDLLKDIHSNIQTPPLIYKAQYKIDDLLFNPLTPYDEGYLKVSQIHSIWYAQYGNPKGVPVLVIHGGPGFGCSSNDMRFFDPNFYRILLFDQRGAQRSIPFADMRENTTTHLISDIEKLRHHFKIDQWLIFGGSWGSTLGIAYGETYPQFCLGFILRGIFLARSQDIHHFWYGIRNTYPKEWEEMVNFLPIIEQSDLLTAFAKRINNPDPIIHMPAARAAMKYDLIAAFALMPAPLETLKNDHFIFSVAKSFVHYNANNFFLRENQILNDAINIKHLPATLIHGRFDTLCQPRAAYELHQQLPQSKLIFVQDGGHSANELGITKSLIEATELMKLVLY